MKEKNSSISKLLDLFDEYIDEDDIMSSQILSQISTEIVKYRIKNKMTQKKFADFLNISQSMVSKIESEDYNFTIKQLVKLSNKMNLYFEVILKDEKPIIKTVNNYIFINSQNEKTENNEKSFQKKYTSSFKFRSQPKKNKSIISERNIKYYE